MKSAMKTPKRKNKSSTIPLPTLGGPQAWLDMFFHAGWRIQKNIFSGKFRLLSPKNIRMAGGSYQSCLDRFSEIRKKRNLQNGDTHLVLMVHGMAGWKETFFLLKRALRKNGYFADAYNYPSLKGALAEQAKEFNDFLNLLDGITAITLIGHSQGGFVIRKALETKASWQNRIAVRGMILLGTPNQGAALADFSKRLKVLGKLAPKVRDQLTKDYAKTLKAPVHRMGLIAGSARKGKGINPLIDGDDDGIVGVEEVWIDGHDDRLVVPSDHFTLANRKKTIVAVLRFLEDKKLSDV